MHTLWCGAPALAAVCARVESVATTTYTTAVRSDPDGANRVSSCVVGAEPVSLASGQCPIDDGGGLC